jgi:hypothetical protein
MMRWMMAGAMVLALGLSQAVAQSGSSTTVAPSSGRTLPQAPVGHRQPTQADIGKADTGISKEDEADRALDRKIRSICRGC